MSEVVKQVQVLVVEDDPSIAATLVRGLKGQGMAVELATDGDRGAALATSGRFDVAVIDLGLPGRDGYSILDAMKDRVATRAIVLTAHRDLDSRLQSLRAGAVDWMAKPFYMEELIERIRLRLQEQQEKPRQVAFADVVVDLDGRRVTVGGRDAGLTATELNVLCVLVQRPGRAVGRQQLAELALGETASDRTVDSYVARLRGKLSPEGAARIQTVWGIGYRFEPDA